MRRFTKSMTRQRNCALVSYCAGALGSQQFFLFIAIYFAISKNKRGTLCNNESPIVSDG